MKKFINSILFLILSNIFFISCSSVKDVIYFQDTENTENNYINEKIKEHDILNISVTALDQTSIQGFLEEKMFSKTLDKLLIDGYRVTNEGNINLPLIGIIKIMNLTPKEASEKIQLKLSESIIDPIVNVRILNYKITVLGEVNNPGTFSILDPKINIIQALGMAGDLTIYGKRKNIKIIRDENGLITNTTIDLTKNDFMNSDYFYLRKNDILYIEPTFAKIKNAGYVGNISNIATVFSLISSIIILSR